MAQSENIEVSMLEHHAGLIIFMASLWVMGIIWWHLSPFLKILLHVFVFETLLEVRSKTRNKVIFLQPLDWLFFLVWTTSSCLCFFISANFLWFIWFWWHFNSFRMRLMTCSYVYFYLFFFLPTVLLNANYF